MTPPYEFWKGPSFICSGVGVTPPLDLDHRSRSDHAVSPEAMYEARQITRGLRTRRGTRESLGVGCLDLGPTPSATPKAECRPPQDRATGGDLLKTEGAREVASDLRRQRGASVLGRPAKLTSRPWVARQSQGRPERNAGQLRAAGPPPHSTQNDCRSIAEATKPEKGAAVRRHGRRAPHHANRPQGVTRRPGPASELPVAARPQLCMTAQHDHSTHEQPPVNRLLRCSLAYRGEMQKAWPATACDVASPSTPTYCCGRPQAKIIDAVTAMGRARVSSCRTPGQRTRGSATF